MNLKLKHGLFYLGISLYCILSCEEKIPEGPKRSEIVKVKLTTKENRTDYSQENNWENRYHIPPRKMSLEEFEYLSQWQVPFHITVYNDFDEAIDGMPWVKIKINLWPEQSEQQWQAQLLYADTTSTRHLTIPPGDSIAIYTGIKLTWDQKDTAGKSIHLTCSFTPKIIDCYAFESDSAVDRTVRPLKFFRKTICDTTELAPEDTVLAFSETKVINAQAEVQIFKNYRTLTSNIFQFKIHYFYPFYGFRKKYYCNEAYYYPWDPIPSGCQFLNSPIF